MTDPHANLRADVARIFEARGGRSRLAEALGVTRQAIQGWREGVPDSWVDDRKLHRAVRSLIKALDAGKWLAHSRKR